MLINLFSQVLHRTHTDAGQDNDTRSKSVMQLQSQIFLSSAVGHRSLTLHPSTFHFDIAVPVLINPARNT